MRVWETEGGQPCFTLRLTSSAAHSSLGQEGSEGCMGEGLSLPRVLLLFLREVLLTVLGLAPLPRVRCRWQLKISSALRRYLVIFSFTASRLSLLGSTVGNQGSPSVVTRTVLHPLSWAYWWLRCQLRQLRLPVTTAHGSYFSDSFSWFIPPALCVRSGAEMRDA
jgi:hypothetical protein